MTLKAAVIVLLAFPCFGCGSRAPWMPDEPVSTIGRPPVREVVRSEIGGPWVSTSVPTGTSGEAFDNGISIGVTATRMRTQTTGFGVDVGYSRWLSPMAGAIFDDLFSLWGSAPVRGTKATLTTLRGGVHLKAVPLPRGRVSPWAQIGIGVSRANAKLEFPVDQLVAAGWQVGEPIVENITYQPDFMGGVGLDFKTGAGVTVGLNASYRGVFFADDEALTVLTIGGHVLFGHW